VDDIAAEWYDIWAGATLSGVAGWDTWTESGQADPLIP
jgi:hypothetical protein